MITRNENRFIQYELWKDCRNGCNFCFSRAQPSLDKIVRLNYVIEKLQDKEVDDYNEIGFIGGEFFDIELYRDDVRKLFYKLFDICFEKVKANKLDKIYLATNLIYDMNNYLIPFLEYVKGLGILDKILLCTSYDLKYRFKTEEKHELWKRNMKQLHITYPEMKLHTEIIVTQTFIDNVLDDSFSITDFKETYHTGIDYIEPSSGFYFNDKKDCSKEMPDFFPTKKSFIKFLKKVSDRKEIDLSTFLSMEVRSNKIYDMDYGPTVIDNRREEGVKIEPVDKSKKYEIGFIDSNEKMVDIVRLFNDINR